MSQLPTIPAERGPSGVIAAFPQPKRSDVVAARELAFSEGLRPFALNYLLPDGTCSCGREGDACGRGKEPIGKGWKDAKTHQQIRESFPYGICNVGIVTGRFKVPANNEEGYAWVDGVDVLDLDTEEGLAWIKARGEIPHTRIVKTSRGYHLYFQHDDRAENSKAFKGIEGGPPADVKGTGGFVVAPPSNHKSGSVYRYLEGHGPEVKPAKWPQFLLDLFEESRGNLRAKAEAKSGHKITASDLPFNPQTIREDFTVQYVQAVISGCVSDVMVAEKGDRNNALNKAAFKVSSFVHVGLATLSDFDRVLDAARDIGLTEREIRGTAKGAWGRGALVQPRPPAKRESRAGPGGTLARKAPSSGMEWIPEGWVDPPAPDFFVPPLTDDAFAELLKAPGPVPVKPEDLVAAEIEKAGYLATLPVDRAILSDAWRCARDLAKAEPDHEGEDSLGKLLMSHAKARKAAFYCGRMTSRVHCPVENGGCERLVGTITHVCETAACGYCAFARRRDYARYFELVGFTPQVHWFLAKSSDKRPSWGRDVRKRIRAAFKTLPIMTVIGPGLIWVGMGDGCDPSDQSVGAPRSVDPDRMRSLAAPGIFGEDVEYEFCETSGPSSRSDAVRAVDRVLKAREEEIQTLVREGRIMELAGNEWLSGIRAISRSRRCELKIPSKEERRALAKKARDEAQGESTAVEKKDGEKLMDHTSCCQKAPRVDLGFDGRHIASRYVHGWSFSDGIKTIVQASRDRPVPKNRLPMLAHSPG